MLLTRKYVQDLTQAMIANDIEEVDLIEDGQNRVRAWMLERKITKKPLKVGATTTPASTLPQNQPGGEGEGEGGGQAGLQGTMQ